MNTDRRHPARRIGGTGRRRVVHAGAAVIVDAHRAIRIEHDIGIKRIGLSVAEERNRTTVATMGVMKALRVVGACEDERHPAMRYLHVV